jgi:hypothetical protein
MLTKTLRCTPRLAAWLRLSVWLRGWLRGWLRTLNKVFCPIDVADGRDISSAQPTQNLDTDQCLQIVDRVEVFAKMRLRKNGPEPGWPTCKTSAGSRRERGICCSQLYTLLHKVTKKKSQARAREWLSIPFVAPIRYANPLCIIYVSLTGTCAVYTI